MTVRKNMGFASYLAKGQKWFMLFLGLSFLAGIFLLARPISAATEETALIRQDCSGYSKCYTSLSAWETAYGGIDFGACAVGNLVCADKIAVAQIDGDWTSPDTSAVAIDGW